MRSIYLTAALIVTMLTAAAAGVVSPTADGAYRLTNEAAEYCKLSASDLRIDRPVAFELGREGRHLRRVYPSVSRGTIIIDAVPRAEYAVYQADVLVDEVLLQVCGVEPGSLSIAQKLEALASKASNDSDADRHARRRAVEALQVMLGLRFTAKMDYRSFEGGDYRVYAGSDFRVTCSATNGRIQQLSGIRFGLMAPDEWDVRLGRNSVGSLGVGSSVSSMFTVRAPGRSSMRAPVSPMIATLTFCCLEREFTIHYPFEVRLSDPFAPKLSITKASTDYLEARIDLKTTYPGRDMKQISVYPWLATDLTIGPALQAVNMSAGRGGFRLAYLPQRSGASYQAVTVIMKLDEHLVRLRSVMEASLDLGATTRGAALWLNDYSDGNVISVTTPEHRYRKTAVEAGRPGYMYFAVSPNMPAAGKTYVTVTYLDGGSGSFALEYDSAKSAYSKSEDIVKLGGSGAWKTKTFVLEDATFGDRQNAASDFRLVALDGELAVSMVTVSKFPPGDSAKP